MGTVATFFHVKEPKMNLGQTERSHCIEIEVKLHFIEFDLNLDAVGALRLHKET